MTFMGKISIEKHTFQKLTHFFKIGKIWVGQFLASYCILNLDFLEEE